MIGHYLRSALAKFRKTPFTTGANILTLALGLACFIAAYGIATFLSSSDSYHAKADRTYIVGQSVTRPGEERSPPGLSSNPALARYLTIDVPEVESVARITPDPGVAVAAGPTKMFLDTALADPGIVDIFDFDFVAGDPRSALDAPGSVVLTEDAAARLFGDSPALGQRLIIAGSEEGVVTGVIAPVRQPSFMGAALDAPVRFDMLRNFSSSVRGGQLDLLENWSAMTGVTFVLLPQGMSVDAFNARLPAIVANRVSQEQQDFFDIVMHAFPLEGLLTRGLDNILLEGSGVDVSVIHVLVGLGVLTLLIACVNYANLAAAQGATRGKEIGMRRVLGAARGQVMAQAWLEAAILTGAAVAIALGALAFAAPVIRASVGIDILYFIGQGLAPVGVLTGLALLVALLAGAYPALVLSRVRPVSALRAGRSRSGPRFTAQILVGMQFASAGFLLILVTVSQLQRDYLERTALAPRAAPIVILNDLMPLDVNFDTLATQLEGRPGIESISVVDRGPWDMNGMNPLMVKRTPEPGVNGPVGYIKSVGYDYFATFNLDLLAGRVFDRARDTTPKPTYFFGDDPAQPVDIVIDRSFAERLGFASPEAAVDQIVYRGDTDPAQVMRIIGVTETEATRVGAANVAGQSFFDGTIYTFAPRAVFGGQHPVVRIDRNQVAAAVAAITEVWDGLAPNVPVDIRFFDALFEQSFRTYARVSQIFVVLGVSAFIIASVGLVGIAVHVTARRRHEIGVRKTLGASTMRVLRMLIADFSKPVIVGNLIAWPFAWMAAQTYLQSFAQRTPLTPLPFILSLAFTLLIAWVSVGGQAWRAATVKPALVLRAE